MFQRFRCCECYRVQNSSLSQQVLSKIVAYCRWCERNLKFFVKALLSWNMSSERDINSTLVDAAKALQASNGTTSSDLERARNAVRSLPSFGRRDGKK